ncbi:g3922 [Coccomyxa elongata]
MAAEELTPFVLLQAGQRGRDEAWGGSDLMEYFQLMRLYKFSQTDLVPTNYLKGVPGDTTLWRNQGTDIAPLADSYPSAQRPSLEPFSAETLERAFKLQPGKFSLTEVEKGTPVALGTVQPGAPEKQAKKEKKKDKQGQKRKQDAR